MAARETNRANDGTLMADARIDVDGAFPYAIPPDNPFAARPSLGEIWNRESAIRIGGVSIGRPATCGSATSGSRAGELI
jgi:hypothetical protein